MTQQLAFFLILLTKSRAELCVSEGHAKSLTCALEFPPRRNTQHSCLTTLLLTPAVDISVTAAHTRSRAEPSQTWPSPAGRVTTISPLTALLKQQPR